MVTKHAQENWAKYRKHMTTEQAKSVLVATAKAEKSSGSVAVVTTISAVENPYRDDWKPNDRLVVVIRNGIVKTVMLSRASQMNKSHLRTDRIVKA